jgi:SNF2 family DNA or RNA helicase
VSQPEALFAHQRTAAAFLAERKAALYWGDPGIGKTAAAVQALLRIEAKRCLIFTPLTAVIHWQRELWRWGRLKSHVPRSKNGLRMQDILVLNPDKLYNPEILNGLRQMQFDALILDECQAYKNAEAKRTRYIYGKGGLVHRARRTWALSGTPCPNGPVDLFVMLKVLFPETIGGLTRDAYIEHYHILDADKIRILGTRNMNQLSTALQPYVLRQRVDECDLPPLLMGTMPLDRDDLELDGEALDHAMHKAHADGWQGLDEGELLNLVTDSVLHLSTVRMLLSAAKARAVGMLAADELAAGRPKLVIFAWHLYGLFKLNAYLASYNPALLTGSVPQAQREQAIQRFQTDGACRVLLAHGDVGGLGITLHAANEAWFIDTPWTPSSVLQAVKRLHRIGQTLPVIGRVFTVAGTIDDAVSRILVRKTRMITDLQPDAVEGQLA